MKRACSLLLNLTLWAALASPLLSGPETVSPYIMIDQFGYLPDAPKVAVLADPQVGFNATDQFTPGTTYQVRRWTDDMVVFSGAPMLWNGGITQASSGDRGWWFDFSSVTAPGSYYIFDVDQQLGSYRFDIRDDIYHDVLKAALRMFFYQRANEPKTAPYADPRWTDAAAFVGPNQDGEARNVLDPTNASTARNLTGGWFDAGDTNKYVTFANGVVHQLLTAYEINPGAFDDALNIPESGNGLPDLIDELKVELDWLLKMQNPDGGVLIKMGLANYENATPPSSITLPRYYGRVCSSSTISLAGMFAHAALVLQSFPSLTTYAATLQSSAVNAWNWYQTNPRSENCDNGEVLSGDADVSLHGQDQAEVVAAIYLYALTGNANYHTVVTAHYTVTQPYEDDSWSRYRPEQGDALLYYTTLAGANTTVKNNILTRKTNEAGYSHAYGMAPNADLYRAYMPDDQHHWGSNSIRANYGNTNLDLLVHNLDPTNHTDYRHRALAHLQYLHGVNPLHLVYLTNMYAYGAEFSANEMYHTWFSHGSIYDHALNSPNGPAPGYVVGGPNKNYGGGVSPPSGEPVQKSYLDWNTGWPENSWEISEPSISYQAAYIKLLSYFISAPGENKVRLSPRFFLSGAYENGQMHTALQSGGYLPLSQPYGIEPWHYTGPESVTRHTDQTVDWVLVSLRTDLSATATVSTKAGVLTANGYVVDAETGDALSFEVPPGPYHVVVRHRNHLDAISAETASLHTNASDADFTGSGDFSFGMHPIQDMEDGHFALWGGDGNANGMTTAFDFLHVWLPANGAPPGYEAGDFDLNGMVTAFDFLSVWLPANGTSTGVLD